MTDGQLITCPQCAQIGKRQILGKIMENGDFLILRFHQGTTIVKAIDYTIICGCGYNHTVSGTAITVKPSELYVENGRSNIRS